MTRSLPTAPNLEHLKKQAKALLKLHRNQNADALPTLRLLHQFNNLSDREILDATLSLNETQMAVALDYGFKSWGDLKKHMLGRTENLKYLHIHCGDASAQPLRNSSVPGDVFVWREIYIEGPAPGDLSDSEFSIARAKYLATWGLDPSDVLAGRCRKTRTLAEAGKYGEVVLWFDPCMFDQTILIKVLDQYSHQEWSDTKLSLVYFDITSELTAESVVSFMDTRHEITPDEISLAQVAWRAFTSANPVDIEDLLKGDCSSLPYLKAALTRHLEQYPSARNGLNRTQNQILQAVVGGATKLPQIFKTVVHDMEDTPFMGDSSLWTVIEAMANSKVPSLRVSGPELSELTRIDPEAYEPPSAKKLRQWDVSITDIGREVLSGKQDFIRLSGIDRWIGGVNLQETSVQWRWDSGLRRLVQQAAAGKPVSKRKKSLQKQTPGNRPSTEDLLDTSSLSRTVDSIDSVLFYGGSIPSEKRVGLAEWIAGRQGGEGSYNDMFAPVSGELDKGMRLFTGERLPDGAGARHILGEEACRVLRLLDVDTPLVNHAIDEASKGVIDTLNWENSHSDRPWRQPGIFCCAKCSVAVWRHLAVIRNTRSEELLTHGLNILKSFRTGDGRWKFPFDYTLLTLLEIDTPSADDELVYASEMCRSYLQKRTSKTNIYSQRKRMLAERVLSRLEVSNGL